MPDTPRRRTRTRILEQHQVRYERDRFRRKLRPGSGVSRSLKSELAGRFDSCGGAKMQLFDYIEVFYNQRRRHSTLGQISPAEFERRTAAA